MKIDDFVGIELEMLADAIEQYVQNTEDVEDELSPSGRARLATARELQGKISARYAGSRRGWYAGPTS